MVWVGRRGSGVAPVVDEDRVGPGLGEQAHGQAVLNDAVAAQRRDRCPHRVVAGQGARVLGDADRVEVRGASGVDGDLVRHDDDRVDLRVDAGRGFGLVEHLRVVHGEQRRGGDACGPGGPAGVDGLGDGAVIVCHVAQQAGGHAHQAHAESGAVQGAQLVRDGARRTAGEARIDTEEDVEGLVHGVRRAVCGPRRADASATRNIMLASRHRLRCTVRGPPHPRDEDSGP